MVAHQTQRVYMKKSGARLGKAWAMNRASRVALPECMLGKAPKTCGLAGKVLVYRSIPKRRAMAARPAGEATKCVVCGVRRERAMGQRGLEGDMGGSIHPPT